MTSKRSYGDAGRITACRAAVLALGVLGLIALAGCVHEGPYRGVNHAIYVDKGGPPPWAPAHGYRHKHADGSLLVYDAGLGSYRVEGHPGCYFNGGRFFCRRAGVWNAGPALGGPWTVVSVRSLPPGIAKKYAVHPAKGHRGGKRGHGHHPGHGPH